MISEPYRNDGNELVLSMVPRSARRILDVGCGAGDNARRLLEVRCGLEIVGITHNGIEAEMARRYMNEVKVIDIESDPLVHLAGGYDLIIFSHVLEHLRNPVQVLEKFMPLLVSGGHVLIVVPNLLEWRTRFNLLCGRFEYADHGVLDRTHLRFFTYYTAADELIGPISELNQLSKMGRGSVPLGPLRRHLLSKPAKNAIDRIGVQFLPNLFAGEVALLATKLPQ